MRFRVVLLGLLVASVALAGCSGGGGGDEDGDDPSAPQRTALRMGAPAGYEQDDDGAGGSDGSGDAGGDSGGAGGSGDGSGDGGGSDPGDDGSDGGDGSDPGDDGEDGSGDDGSDDGDGSDPGADPGDGSGAGDEPDGGQDPLRFLLGGLPPGFDWQNLSDASGVDYDAGGLYDDIPLDLDDPRPPSGDELGSWDPEALLESLEAQGELAGYSFSASALLDGDLRHYDLSLTAGDVQQQPLRSLLLSPKEFVSYVDAGGDLTRVGDDAEAALADALVHEAVFQVLPLVYAIEGDDGSRAEVVLYLPLDAENPKDYWRPVGMAYDDGVHAGSWEFAPRGLEDRPRLRDDGGHVAVPYMAGDSVEELAAWDVLLAIHGLNLYSEYPAQGVPLPAPEELPGVVERASDDVGGWLFGQVDDPTGLTADQYYVFGHDVKDVEGLAAAYEEGLQVHHEERTEDRVQWFRVGLAPGLPVPTYLEVGSRQDGGEGHAVRVDLSGVAGLAGGAVPDLPGLGDLPGGLPLP